MKEHSDLKEHQVNDRKAVARFTESGEDAFCGKYDKQNVNFEGLNL